VAPEFGNLTVNVLSGKSEKHNKNFTWKTWKQKTTWET
jgi:hypothetical protein